MPVPQTDTGRWGAYRKCIEAHQNRTDEILERMSRDLSKKLGIDNLVVSGKNGIVHEFMQDVNHQVAKSVKNVTGKTSGAFPSTTISSFKLILRTKKHTDIIDVTLEKYDEIRNSTIKDLATAYTLLEESALERFDSIYHTQVEMGREAINQTMDHISASAGATYGLRGWYPKWEGDEPVFNWKETLPQAKSYSKNRNQV